MDGRLRICFEVDGLAVNQDGNPSAAGLQLDFGDVLSESVDYEKLTADIDISKMLEISFLGKHVDPESVKVITPKEYDEKYGNGELKINKEKLDEYLANDIITEFETAEEAMNWMNLYDYQKFKNVDEMKKYLDKFGFGIGEKWYLINFEDAFDVYE